MVLQDIPIELVSTLRNEDALNTRGCFIIDTSFTPARGGGIIWADQMGKGKILAVADHHRLRLSVSTHAVDHDDVTLVQLSDDFYMLKAKSEHLIGELEYDSDALDEDLL